MKKIAGKTLMLVAVAATLLSFTNFGGEGFEITLNNKVVVQQYGTKLNNTQRLRLNQHSANDQLTIKYHHCGKVGKNRVVTLKDVQNKVVKEWRFADVATPVGPMKCNVKEILDLAKKNDTELKLYYTSSELPGGRLLAKIVVDSYSIAINK